MRISGKQGKDDADPLDASPGAESVFERQHDCRIGKGERSGFINAGANSAYETLAPARTSLAPAFVVALSFWISCGAVYGSSIAVEENELWKLSVIFGALSFFLVVMA